MATQAWTCPPARRIIARSAFIVQVIISYYSWSPLFEETYEMKQKNIATFIVACVLGLIGLGSLMGHNDRAAAGRTSFDEKHKLGLGPLDDGYAWERADYAQRMRVCRHYADVMDRFPGRRDAKWYYGLLYDYYTGNPNKAATMNEIVALGVAVHASE